MTLADPRFAGQLVTTTGKSIPFDDVGCLAEYVAAGQVSRERIASLWVGDFTEPDSLVEVHRAVFLRSDSLRTPMDHQVVALRPGHAADSARAALGGVLLTWDQVLAQAAKQLGH
jgi:copper chaperone NosL